MQKYFYKYLELILLVTLMLLSGGSLWVAHVASGTHQTINALGANLCAGFVMAIVTIFGIELLRRKRDAWRMVGATKAAREEVKILTNMLVSYLSEPLGKTILDHPQNTGESVNDWADRAIRAIATDLTTADNLPALNAKLPKEWEYFGSVLLLMRQNLGETLKIYAALFPPEVLGHLLNVRREFERIMSNFSVVRHILITDKASWSTLTGSGVVARAFPDRMIAELDVALRRYFVAVRGFIEATEEAGFVGQIPPYQGSNPEG
ncbi:MAG TPA: hypothetical protein VMU25_03325 [Candidatus Paceibacterota bacterium]|nr:hypothetical protein [Candidatus Paceibacterota bacterium]